MEFNKKISSTFSFQLKFEFKNVHKAEFILFFLLLRLSISKVTNFENNTMRPKVFMERGYSN